tara:strand:- start:7033 stop:7371 length:339 start_codon:yes stop_codon:yes gene_type:complete
MSDFFKSEIVREELKEINALQEELYSDMTSFNVLDRDDRLEHIDKLVTLLEKQRLMYTRLSLSDDPDAKKLKDQLQKSVTMMGFPEGTDIQVLFSGMENTIDKLKQFVDYQS